MTSNNRKSKTRNKSIKLTTKDKVFFRFLLISVILFYLVFIIFFFIPNYSVISDIYSNFYFNIIFTLVIVGRISLSIYGSYFLFKIWLSKNTRAYSDLPFILGLFFFIFIPGKLMDLIIILTYRMYASYGFSYILFLDIIKIRYLILIINLIPLFLSGIYLFLFRLNLKKPHLEREKISKRLTVLFSSLYFPTFFFIILFLNDIYLFSYIGAILTSSTLSFVIWIFFTVYRGKILPEINSLIISIGFICYMIFNVLLPIYVNVIGQISLEGERIAGSILECGTFFSMITILIGFKKKAHYKQKVNQMN